MPTTAQLWALVTYAALTRSTDLLYRAYDALGVNRRVGGSTVPVPLDEQQAAQRWCAGQIEMLRLMGTDI